MRLIHHFSDGFALSFPYDPPLVEAVKSHFAWKRWDGERRVWGVCVDGLEKFARDHNFQWTHEASKVFRADSSASRATDADISLPQPLRGYQKAGVKYIVESGGRCFVADSAGVGKSAQVLVANHLMNGYPCIVVTKASLKYQFQDEIKKWFPKATTHVIDGETTYELPGVQFYILSYGILGPWIPSLRAMRPEAIFLDESHMLKTWGRDRFNNVMTLVDGVRVRLPISGTPTEGRNKEYAPQLEIMGLLGPLFGGRWKFYERYCGLKQTEWGKDYSRSTHTEELQEILRSKGRFLSRRKEDVLPELPPKQITPIRVSLSNPEEYMRVQNEIRDALRLKLAKDESYWVLPQDAQRERLKRLLQTEKMVSMTRLRQVCGKGKLSFAKEWISDKLEEVDKLVVFSHHREIASALTKKFPQALTIVGDDSPQERHKAQTLFGERPERNLLVANIEAGGAGLNLTMASHCVFLELPWTPTAFSQACDRLHRFGQGNAVNAYVLYAPGTMEDRVLEILQEKDEVVAAASGMERVMEWILEKRRMEV